MTNKELSQIYNDLNVVQYNQLQSCIPKSWKQIMKEQTVTEYYGHYQALSEYDKVASIVYEKFVTNPNVIIEKFSKITEMISNNIVLEDYAKAFQRLYKITDVSKFRSFQFRLLHNIVFLNNR